MRHVHVMMGLLLGLGGAVSSYGQSAQDIEKIKTGYEAMEREVFPDRPKPEVITSFAELVKLVQMGLPVEAGKTKMVGVIGWNDFTVPGNEPGSRLVTSLIETEMIKLHGFVAEPNVAEGMDQTNKLAPLLDSAEIKIREQVEQGPAPVTGVVDGSVIFLLEGGKSSIGYGVEAVRDFNKGVAQQNVGKAHAIGFINPETVRFHIERAAIRQTVIDPFQSHVFLGPEQPKALPLYGTPSTMDPRVALLVEHSVHQAAMSDGVGIEAPSKLIVLGGDRATFVQALDYVYLAAGNPDANFELEIRPDVEPISAEKDTGFRAARALLLFLASNKALLGGNLDLKIYSGSEVFSATEGKVHPIEQFLGSERGSQLVMDLMEREMKIAELETTLETTRKEAKKEIGRLSRDIMSNREKGISTESDVMKQLKRNYELAKARLKTDRAQIEQQLKVFAEFDQKKIFELGAHVLEVHRLRANTGRLASDPARIEGVTVLSRPIAVSEGAPSVAAMKVLRAKLSKTGLAALERVKEIRQAEARKFVRKANPLKGR